MTIGNGTETARPKDSVPGRAKWGFEDGILRNPLESIVLLALVQREYGLHVEEVIIDTCG